MSEQISYRYEVYNVHEGGWMILMEFWPPGEYDDPHPKLLYPLPFERIDAPLVAEFAKKIAASYLVTDPFRRPKSRCRADGGGTLEVGP